MALGAAAIGVKATNLTLLLTATCARALTRDVWRAVLGATVNIFGAQRKVSKAAGGRAFVVYAIARTTLGPLNATLVLFATATA